MAPKDQLAAVRAAIQKKLDEWCFDFESLDDANRIHVTTQIEKYLEELKIGNDEHWLAAARLVGADDNFIDLMSRERRYRGAQSEWKSFQRWKKHRNPDRAKLEEAHGYDTKHGAHLVRLLRMGEEILKTGKVNVWRGDIDAEELLAIRRGAWPYEQMVEWAEAKDKLLSKMYKDKDYVIRNSPNRKAIDQICQDLVTQALGL